MSELEFNALVEAVLFELDYEKKFLLKILEKTAEEGILEEMMEFINSR